MHPSNLKIERRTKKKKIENIMDIVGELPLEVAYEILKMLDLKDLASCWYTCKRWRDLIGDDYFWKWVCPKNNFLEEKIFFKSGIAQKEEYWRLVYNSYVATNIAWIRGLCEEVDYFQYNFREILYLDDEIVVGYVRCDSGMQFIVINHLERKVYAIFGKDTHICTDLIKIHRHKDLLIFCFYKCESNIIYFGAMGDTFIADLNSNQIIGHARISELARSMLTRKQMIICENFIASIIRDQRNCLEVYNIETDLIEYTCSDVLSFGITNGKLAILKNNAVKIVNLKDGSECMLIPCKKILLIKIILVSNTLILSICTTGHICCWCAKTEREVQHFSVTFDDSYEGVLSLHNEKLIYYNIESGSTEVWNARTGNCQFVINNLFYMLSCNSRFMVGVDVGEQRVDLRCFESGRVLVHHLNGFNISELQSSNIIRLFRLFQKFRKEQPVTRPQRKTAEMHTLILSNRPVQITETCLAIISKPAKPSKLDFLKKKKDPKMGITILDFRGLEF